MLDTEFDEFGNDKAQQEYFLGMTCRTAQEYDQALPHFQRSLELMPHYKTCQRVAEMLHALGRTSEAEPYIVQAYELNPNHSQAATEYAKLLSERGLKEDAKSLLIQVLGHNITYSPAKNLLNLLENDT